MTFANDVEELIHFRRDSESLPAKLLVLSIAATSDAGVDGGVRGTTGVWLLWSSKSGRFWPIKTAGDGGGVPGIRGVAVPLVVVQLMHLGRSEGRIIVSE